MLLLLFFLNNIIYDGCNYLEIGSWKGSTTSAALYNNKPNSSISIDNFSQFGGPKEEFWNNIRKFGNDTHIQISSSSNHQIKMLVSFSILF